MGECEGVWGGVRESKKEFAMVCKGLRVFASLCKGAQGFFGLLGVLELLRFFG